MNVLKTKISLFLANHKVRWFMSPINKQSGVIPFLRKKGELQVLLITSRRRKRWIVPKGNIEPGFTAAESAEKEAFEEAGVTGAIFKHSAGEYFYEKYNMKHLVQLYFLEVTHVLEDWPEAAFRKRKWCSLEKAWGLVQEPELKSIIKTLPDQLLR